MANAIINFATRGLQNALRLARAITNEERQARRFTALTGQNTDVVQRTARAGARRAGAAALEQGAPQAAVDEALGLKRARRRLRGLRARALGGTGSQEAARASALQGIGFRRAERLRPVQLGQRVFSGLRTGNLGVQAFSLQATSLLAGPAAIAAVAAVQTFALVQPLIEEQIDKVTRRLLKEQEENLFGEIDRQIKQFDLGNRFKTDPVFAKQQAEQFDREIRAEAASRKQRWVNSPLADL